MILSTLLGPLDILPLSIKAKPVPTSDPWGYIPYREAQMCNDCQAIFRISKRHCPSCGSRHAHTLGKWLERE